VTSSQRTTIALQKRRKEKKKKKKVAVVDSGLLIRLAGTGVEKRDDQSPRGQTNASRRQR